VGKYMQARFLGAYSCILARPARNSTLTYHRVSGTCSSIPHHLLFFPLPSPSISIYFHTYANSSHSLRITPSCHLQAYFSLIPSPLSIPFHLLPVPSHALGNTLFQALLRPRYVAHPAPSLLSAHFHTSSSHSTASPVLMRRSARSRVIYVPRLPHLRLAHRAH
jgi:hypothetical protein